MSSTPIPEPQTECPSSDNLLAFSVGKLPAALRERISTHLDQCARCLTLLAELDEGADSLLAGLRQPLPPGVLPGLPYREPQPPATEARWPARVGRYHIEGEIGHGGMGVVLRAHDPDCQRTLAVKVLLDRHQSSPDLERRFREEAQLTAQLQHPGIAPVHEIGQLADGRPFFAMKLIRGQTLNDLLQRRSDPSQDLPRFLAIFEQICQTLAYAHARGVIHRDLKPANVMVGAFGEVQVMDWGLAKVLGQREDERPAQAEAASTICTVRTSGAGLSSQAGTVLGTPAYMAPEQARGEVDRVDERCDVFGLGALLCVILTGRPPYVGGSKHEVHRQAMGGGLEEAFTRLDGCGADGELVKLTKACLACKMEERPRHAGAVAKAVAAYQEGVRQRLQAAELERAAAQVKAAEERKRRRLLLALGATLCLLLAAVGLGAWWLDRQDSARRTEKAEREGRARAGIETALRQVQDLQRRARWEDADAVLGQAFSRLGEEGMDDLRQQLHETRKNLAMVRELDTIRLEKVTLVDGKYDFAKAAPAYAAAFRNYGLDLRADEGALARRIRSSGIKEQLVAALDDWAYVTPDRQTCQRLLAIARRADPDEWRNQFRSLEVWWNLDRLQRLAARVKVKDLPPTLVAIVGRVLWRLDGDPVSLLKEAQRQNPGEFWLNFELANALSLQWQGDIVIPRRRGRAAEAVGYYRAALVVRPEAGVVYSDLGLALSVTGRLEEAIACYQKAIALDPRFTWAHNNLGVALLDKGDVNGAIAACQRAIDLDPNHPHAHFYLGNALLARGDHDKAIAEYHKAMAFQPMTARAHVGIGSALKARGDLEAAIAEYRRAIALDPKNAWAHANLGSALREKGNLDGAVAACRKAITLDPNLAAAYSQLGAALGSKGDLDGLIAACQQAIALAPRHASAHDNLGGGLLGKGRLDEAIAEFHKAIALDSGNAGTHYNLGLALEAKGSLDGAMAEWQKAITLKPRFAYPYYSLGRALETRGNLPAAIAAWQKAVALDPRYALPHMALGNVLLAKNDLNGAIGAFQKAIALDPRHAPAHCNLGSALYSRGDLDGALAAYRKAIALDPRHASAYYGVGLALFRKENLDGALAAYQKAIALDPNYASAHYGVGLVLAARNNLDGALAAYEKAIALDPRSAPVHADLGNALRGKGNLKAAIAEYQKAITLDPRYTQGHNNLGVALEALGNLDGASAAYRNAIALDPRLALTHNNLGNVLWLKGNLDGAIACYQKAIALDPRLALAHLNLGRALYHGKKNAPAGIAAYQKAIALNPGYAPAHYHLGIALDDRGDLNGAIAAYRKALALNPRHVQARNNLGNALQARGQLEEAIAEFQQTLRIKRDYAEVHNNLGSALQRKGLVEQAIACYRQAIRLKPDLVVGYMNLGLAFQQEGRFAEALAAWKRVHALGSRLSRWPYPSGQWVRQGERLVELDGRLSVVLQGKVKPASAGEWLDFAQVCLLKKLVGAAARFYRESFAAEPKLAGELKTGHRYNAACCAARAGIGQGKDAANLDEMERTRWRKQALDWLRADLTLWARHLANDTPQRRARIVQQLQHWQRDPNLAGLRDEAELAWLPEEERLSCRRFWFDVNTLLERAGQR
jgi:tetratricopeptide (TPR) repeat protein